jgi:hypothetical protein
LVFGCLASCCLLVAPWCALLVTSTLYHFLWFSGSLIKVIAIQKKNKMDFSIYLLINMYQYICWCEQL